MSSRANPSKAEGDRIAEMVLVLVTELVRQVKEPWRDVKYGREPTGVRVTPEMRPFVEKRSDRRKAS